MFLQECTNSAAFMEAAKNHKLFRQEQVILQHAESVLMTNEKEQAERRKHTRFEVREGAFAVLRPDRNIVGEILDISKGGLSFRYITGEEQSRESSGLDILFAGGSFSLAGVPFKTVSDFLMPDGFFSNSTTTRRRGVQFGVLTQEQTGELKSFIGNHTRGEVKAHGR
jgi:hypothetical protein